MGVLNARGFKDYAFLNGKDWSNILVGNDGYPTKDENNDVCIVGNNDMNFKATAIEIYGVKTQA